MFVIFTNPFSKWKNIYQRPIKSMRYHETGLTVCKQHYKSYAREMTSAFDFIESEHGYYRTITHEVLKDRLLQMQNKDKIQILTCESAYQSSLSHIQKDLFFDRCKKCPDAESCRYRQISTQPRQFYYIEFRVV